MQAETLVEKIKSLPPEKITEVEDFVDFLTQRARQNAPPESTANDEVARRTLLRGIAESMRANSFSGNPPRFTREDLHERR